MEFKVIGKGDMGGKARGLARIKDKIAPLAAEFEQSEKKSSIILDIPKLAVVTTEYFDIFIEINNLTGIAFSNSPDHLKQEHFLKALLPMELKRELTAWLENVHVPLAVRSSSLYEAGMDASFACIYRTKMIPNNHADINVRLEQLENAIKLIYASVFSDRARCYMSSTPFGVEDEKMAVIIQEMVGLKYGGRFYPNISGVACSYNFYPFGHAVPRDGVVNLVLGLGKTIMDGGVVWSYSPEYPEVNPPYNSMNEMLEQTQLDFWAVDLSRAPGEAPDEEIEYVKRLTLKEAEEDNTLGYIASTYDFDTDMIHMGVGFGGSRVLNFAPLLQVDLLPVNRLIKALLKKCEQVFGTDVEIEFAITIDTKNEKPVRFGLLQVTPMAASRDGIGAADEDQGFTRENILAISSGVMGNGCVGNLKDIVYVIPEAFNLRSTEKVAGELAKINHKLKLTGNPYILIGFGRWGTSNPWMGIPVDWPEISGARVIIESPVPNASIEPSHGSHFFHHIANQGVFYFSLKKEEQFPVDWEWLSAQTVAWEGKYVRHVRTGSGMTVKVDGRKRRGVIFK